MGAALLIILVVVVIVSYACSRAGRESGFKGHLNDKDHDLVSIIKAIIGIKWHTFRFNNYNYSKLIG